MPHQPEGPRTTLQPHGGVPCGLLRRLLVMAYDAVAVVTLLLVVTAVMLLTPLRDQVAFRDATPTVIDFLVWFFYLAWCWRHGGVTLGMRAWRVRLVNDRGSDRAAPPGWGQCLVRYGVSLVSAAALAAGFAWSLIEARRRTWHDIASGTRLVRTGSGSSA